MEIKLSKFHQGFSSRATAHKLFDAVRAEGVLTVSFKDVHEATPSFCHEMLNIILNEKKMRIKIIDTNDSVKFQINKAIASLKIA